MLKPFIQVLTALLTDTMAVAGCSERQKIYKKRKKILMNQLFAKKDERSKTKSYYSLLAIKAIIMLIS